MTAVQWQGPATVDWIVPDQVTSLTLEVWGAGNSPNYISTAGRVMFGGYVKRTVTVTPGESLRITAGGAPVRRSDNSGTDPGFNGGGTGGGAWRRGGAGATDIRQGGTALTDRVVVAGGAGGAAGELGGYAVGGSSTDNRGGGLGGADTGGVGAQVPTTVSAAGGRGGTQAAGGAAGTGGLNGNGTAGALGVGGNGGITKTSAQVATDGFNTGSTGGGGGGYYGGGGASAPSVSQFYGGGAGSNFPATGAAGLVTTSQGVAPPVWGSDFNADGVFDPPHGFARITYNAPPNAPTVTPFDNGDDTAGVPVTVVHNDPEGDPQSRMDVRWRTGTGAWTTVAPARSDSNPVYTFPASTFNTAGVIGQVVEVQAQTRTADGLISPWSDSAYFTPRLEPGAAPTVTGPSGINTATPAVRIQSGTAFAYYKIDVTGSDASTVLGSWTAVTGAPTTDVTVNYPGVLAQFTTGVSYTFRVRVSVYTNQPVPSPQGNSAAAVANVQAPSVPTLTLNPVPASGAVQVAITNPNYLTDATPPISNEVWRTDQTNNTAEVRVATGVPVNATWTDWQAALNVRYRYRAVAVAGNGNSTSSA